MIATRLGLVLALVVAALGIASVLVTGLPTLHTTTAAPLSVPAVVEPLGTDLRALANSITPRPPDLNPGTTQALRRAVRLIIKPAANEDYASALANLERLEEALDSATESRTGTPVSQRRAALIRQAIVDVRADLTKLS
ncbi:hypothetical protein C5B96_12725 [Subtercola sp. Z020]|uniref:hypothetical protein n=1 Tax=Subtercola sp. Z020 TaxID=2080582 RepID=UPI000CE742B8|nr:hypothetical protein [Subtercola sp. Z020]PPF79420.1 hypothetical protein C5B96_12725 [Subtercola sp. Z020]